MAPKAAQDSSAKTFSAEVVASIIAASGVVIGNKQYAIMAQLDPSKTASGWDHAFRSVKQRAKEITTMMENGELADRSTPAKKAPAGEGQKTPAKRANKSNAEEVRDDGGLPAKKIKREATEEGSERDAEGEEEI